MERERKSTRQTQAFIKILFAYVNVVVIFGVVVEGNITDAKASFAAKGGTEDVLHADIELMPLMLLAGAFLIICLTFISK